MYFNIFSWGNANEDIFDVSTYMQESLDNKSGWWETNVFFQIFLNISWLLIMKPSKIWHLTIVSLFFKYFCLFKVVWNFFLLFCKNRIFSCFLGISKSFLHSDFKKKIAYLSFFCFLNNNKTSTSNYFSFICNMFEGTSHY